MDGGSLNLRNDEVFDKLDSAPRKDVNKLIQLQKETNANNIAKKLYIFFFLIIEIIFFAFEKTKLIINPKIKIIIVFSIGRSVS